MWSHRQSHSVLMGMQDYTVTCEDSLKENSYKTKYTLTIRSSIYTSQHLPKIAQNLCPHKNLHMDVYSSFIHNCQNLDATKMPFSKWMDKWTIVYLDNGIVFSTKKRRATKPWKDIEEPSMHITKWKKPIWKRFQPYDILEKVKLWRQHKDQWLSRVRGGGGMNRQSTEGF